jgi:hypothetical protein
VRSAGAALQNVWRNHTGNDPEVLPASVEAVIGSLGDTLSDEVILEEINGAEQKSGDGLPKEVFAEAFPDWKKKLRTRV